MREVFLSLALLLPAWPASARMHAVRPPEKILWIGAQDVARVAASLKNTGYGEYLQRLLTEQLQPPTA